MWTTALLSALLFASVRGGCYNNEKDYYQELGCLPEAHDAEGCPTSYDCSAMSGRSQDKCHYRGKEYDQGHELESTPDTACLVHCRCGNGHKKGFDCINIECPELFLGPPRPGCYRTHEHGKCCHVKEICADSAEQKTSKPVCEFKGEKLQVGQKFYPDEEACLECICQEGFNGTLVEPFCRKSTCNLELHYADRISDGCIPVFYKENSCCPIGWRCPKPSDTVAAGSDAKAAADSGKTCKFGKLTMRVGDKLSPGADVGADTDCGCRVPPHPTCVQKENS